MNLTLPNIYQHGDFAAGCNQYIHEGAAVKARVEDLAKYAQSLIPLMDAANADRDRANADRDKVQALAQELRMAYQGSGSVSKFRAILAAATSQERNTLADELAAEGARINTLFAAVSHHDGHIGPQLRIAAQKVNVQVLGAIADMQSWNAVSAGIERAIAAQSLAQTDGQVSYPSHGGRTNALIKIAVEARGRAHDAQTRLAEMERTFKGGMA